MEDEIRQLAMETQITAQHRTCHDVRTADPSLISGMYWIDPDGQGVGDDPISVYCNMLTGKRKCQTIYLNFAD